MGRERKKARRMEWIFETALLIEGLGERHWKTWMALGVWINRVIEMMKVTNDKGV